MTSVVEWSEQRVATAIYKDYFIRIRLTTDGWQWRVNLAAKRKYGLEPTLELAKEAVLKGVTNELE